MRIDKIKDFYNEHDFSVQLLILIIGAFIFIWGITYGLYKYTVEIASANIVRVYIEEDRLIYEGKQAFINIQSGGMTTTVTIYKKLYPIPVIDKTYSDKTIRVEGE